MASQEDKREQILVKLEAILNAVKADGMFVWRDRAELDTDELPAYVLLDGIETRSLGSTTRRGPQIMLLFPQIFYVPVPTENQMNEGIGPRLSSHRALLVKSIVNDSQLQDMLGDNGYVEYRGMETDMQTGAEVKGQFKLDFALAYVLNFNKL